MLARLKTLAKGLKAPTTHEREAAYLDDAGDRLDLEYRQRQIDKGMFRARNRYPL